MPNPRKIEPQFDPFCSPVRIALPYSLLSLLLVAAGVSAHQWRHLVTTTVTDTAWVALPTQFLFPISPPSRPLDSLSLSDCGGRGARAVAGAPPSSSVPPFSPSSLILSHSLVVLCVLREEEEKVEQQRRERESGLGITTG